MGPFRRAKALLTRIINSILTLFYAAILIAYSYVRFIRINKYAKKICLIKYKFINYEINESWHQFNFEI